MDIEIEKQTLGSLARLSNVSTTEQVKSYVEGYIKEYSKNTFVHLSGDSNIGTLELSGDLKTTKIEANNTEFGYNNHAELCSVAEGSTNNAIASFSHAEGDGESYAGSKTFTIKTVSDNKLSITLDTFPTRIMKQSGRWQPLRRIFAALQQEESRRWPSRSCGCSSNS